MLLSVDPEEEWSREAADGVGMKNKSAQAIVGKYDATLRKMCFASSACMQVCAERPSWS